MTDPRSTPEPGPAGPQLEFRQKEVGPKGTFTAWHDGQHAATMTYSRLKPELIIVDHTEVDPAHRGKGVGEALVEHLVGWARANGQEVIPLCPFTKAVLERHAEWQDIVHR